MAELAIELVRQITANAAKAKRVRMGDPLSFENLGDSRRIFGRGNNPNRNVVEMLAKSNRADALGRMGRLGRALVEGFRR